LVLRNPEAIRINLLPSTLHLIQMASARLKGIRSILKGGVILGSYLAGFGMLGSIIIGVYNGAKSLISAYRKRTREFLGYGAGALACFVPGLDILYGLGLEATGAARIVTNRPMFYDFDAGSAAPYIRAEKV
jgi:hypothetical protein